jgi:hypothetical protein
MADFLYWIPGASVAGRAAAEKAGLAYALGAGDPLGLASSGPGEGPGVLLAMQPDARVPRYRPDSQTWRQFKTPAACGNGAACGLADQGHAVCEVWIGWARADPPGPEDLARSGAMGGLPVALNDGRNWLVPVVHRLDDRQTDLPQVYDLGDDGRWVGRIDPRYAGLWEKTQPLAAKYYEAATGGKAEGTWTVADELGLAAEALAVHYRVGPREIAALGLLGSRSLVAICEVLIDVRGFSRLVKELAAAQKKTPPPAATEAPSTGSGEAG